MNFPSNDDAMLARIVHANLFGVRFSGIMIGVTGLLIGAGAGIAAVSGASGGRPVEPAVVGIALAGLLAAGAGFWLFGRGRRPRSARLYRLLVSDAASIRTLKFVGIVGMNASYVYLGRDGARAKQISFPGSVAEARAFFGRLCPDARVEQAADSRRQGPSGYDR